MEKRKIKKILIYAIIIISIMTIIINLLVLQNSKEEILQNEIEQTHEKTEQEIKEETLEVYNDFATEENDIKKAYKIQMVGAILMAAIALVILDYYIEIGKSTIYKATPKMGKIEKNKKLKKKQKHSIIEPQKIKKE